MRRATSLKQWDAQTQIIRMLAKGNHKLGQAQHITKELHHRLLARELWPQEESVESFEAQIQQLAVEVSSESGSEQARQVQVPTQH